MKPISSGSKENFQKAIMERGFYPEELPPCFEVSGFFDAAKKLNLFRKGKAFKAYRRKAEIKKEGLELTYYNASKRGFQRRLFSCANPLFYIRAASFFGKERGKISSFLRKKGTHYSCSIPQFEVSGHRAITIKPFWEFDKAKREKLSTFPYLVKIDTSRFYPSLYTHAIPWAYHGKSKAKSSQDRDLTMNEIDKIIRSAQRNQTIGIPVGPDTSRIVSEIIAVAVDAEFRKKVDGNVYGVRLVDDVVFGAESEAHGQQILNAYREALREFELDINEIKTRIIPSSQDLEPYWVFAIKRDLGSGNDLVNVLDNIIRTANEQNDDGIIKFALRQIDNLKLLNAKWEIIEPYLMRVTVNFPHCIPYVVKIVVWVSNFEKVDMEKWKRVCHLIIKTHAPLGHDAEVTWACWLLKNLTLESKITKKLLSIILQKGSAFPALIAVDLAYSESKAMLNEARKLVTNRLSDHSMRESDWLLSYECERLFGFPFLSQKNLDYPVFQNLLQYRVQFYSKEIFIDSCQRDKSSTKTALDDFGSLYDEDDFGSLYDDGL